MILGGVSSFQVCKLGCKILISGSALSGSRLPRSLQNGPFLVTGFHAFLFSFTVLRAASMRYTDTKAACRSRETRGGSIPPYRTVWRMDSSPTKLHA
nr:MAG TPA: hypothetical protein [Caudoviricetes sp.]